MRFSDPLDSWLMYYNSCEELEDEGAQLEAVRRSLDGVDHRLANTPAGKKPDYFGHGLGLNRRAYGLIRLPPADLERIQELYGRIQQRGGSGMMDICQILLDLTAMSADPISVPFWEQSFDKQLPRAKIAGKRRQYALAALALLVITGNEKAAWEPLLRALSHSKPESRMLAAYYLRRICEQTGRPLSWAAQEKLERLAGSERSLDPRFMARRTLAATGNVLPPEVPDGSYAFKVWHSLDETAHRVIEIASLQTLDHLHQAIQQAWDWDADHLYAFYPGNRLHDPRFEFGHDYMDDVLYYAIETRIGDLGLRRRNRMLYWFDFGDNHVFVAEVVAVKPVAESGQLPRVVEAVGETLSQYERHI